MRGYCGIGIYAPKMPVNVGVLWRSAQLLGADWIFTIGARYKRQPSDRYNAAKHLPLMSFDNRDQFRAFLDTLPRSVQLVGVELCPPISFSIGRWRHPERAVYLLGSEDDGLPTYMRDWCQPIIHLPGERSMNVAMAGTIVLYDRLQKGEK